MNTSAAASPCQAARPRVQIATKMAEVQNTSQTVMKPILTHSSRLRRRAIGYWLRCR